MSVRRRSLMLSCASLAIAAAAMAPREARAQAFNGTMAPTTSATQTFTGTGMETITVNSSTATLNWTPDNSGTGNINFLPSANTATFTSASGITDYTVLNRIVPLDATRAIELNGTVLSTLEGGATTGGNVWFYSPGGIVVGATAVFDVGGLLLSTIDLSSFSNSTSGFSASFAKTQTGAGAIQILNGATLNALQQNSYIALVAPRIEQGGNFRVNGSAAYVAAEQLTMTMSQGLFDIQVDVTGGTADANGIVHTGSTTGPANETASHNIYMAAVPKNQALTMLLRGTVGYDATTAFVDNGQIILSAGKTPSYYGFSGWSAITEGAIQITGGNFTSDVRAVANTGIYADTSTGPLSFAGKVWFEANGPVVLSAFEGQALTVGGDAWLWSPAGAAGQVTIAASSGGSIDIDGDARLLSQGQFDGTNTVGGNVNITADGGNVTIDGSVQADVGAYAWQSDINGNSSDAYGGRITLLATNGGTLTAGELYADASADGGDTQGGGDGIAGNGQGGSITVQSDFGGAVHVIGSLHATAYGSGGYIGGSGVAAGTGQGGNILLTANGGAIRTGWLYGSAGGSGGSVYAESTTVSGASGRGGFVRLVTHDVASSITVDDSVYIYAGGFGGGGLNGGTGYGGSAGIQSFAGAIGIGGSVGLSAYGGGGSAYGGYGGTGGSAYGGEAYIQAQVTNGPASSISAGDVYLNVDAYGGYGGAGDGGQIAAGAGGSAQGGLFNGQIGSGGAFVLADAAGATLQLGYVSMHANAYGGTGGTGGAGQAGGAGGDATGGFVQAGGFNPTGTTNPTGSATFGNVYMSAGAYGGSGGAGDNGQGGAPNGNGGNASGGGNTICGETGQTCGGAVLNAKGDVTTDSIYIYAGAYGGSGATGGNALGGKAFVQSFADSTLASSGSVNMQTPGFGGRGYTGTGGAGTGGLGFVGVRDNSTMSVAGGLYVDSSGGGGYGVTGGAATGGRSLVRAHNGGSLTAGTLLLWSPGYGGAGDTVGGDAIGGTTATLINGGTVSAGSLRHAANGYGGYGETGGNATGGTVSITYSPSGGTITSGNSYLEADGYGGGGASGSGGSGTGGDVDVAVTAASAFNAGWLDMSASGVGGYSNSGAAGAGVGGTSTALVSAGGTLTAGYFGNFADADGGSSATGSGGSANAGTAEVIADGGVISIGDSGLRLGANGSGGTGSSAGADGRGGSSSLAITANGGSISVTGFTSINANGRGGAGRENAEGTGGTGGNGYGGAVLIDIPAALAAEATAALNLADAHVFAVGHGGYGGAGTSGGLGGNGYGGNANVNIGSGTATMGGVFSHGGGYGGSGGSGSAGAGGDGGDGTGGSNSLTVAGSLNARHFYAFISTIGGRGGSGTTAGAGGAATAGSNRVDVLAGGSANFIDGVVATSFAMGGEGSTGGAAQGGRSAINVQGSLTSGGIVQSTASAGGGAGLSGAGGNGTAGTATIDVSGSFDAASLYVATNAIGGNGATTGGNAFAGSSTLSVTGSATAVDSTVTANGTGGNGADGDSGPGSSTAGEVLVRVEHDSHADLGTATLAATGGSGTGAVTIDLGAGGTTGILAGNLLFANSMTITSSGTIDVLSQNGAGINVTDMFAATADGLVSLDDQSSGASLSATGISLDGGSVFSDWAFNAGGDIYLSSSGNLRTGDLTARGAIDLDAGGDILFGNASADTFDFDAGGAATGGNVTAVTQANGDAQGAIVLGNITVGPGLVPSTDFSVGFSSATSITVGNVRSVDRVGFATLGPLTTGDIIAGSLVMTLVGGNISLGSITTNPDGTVYLADASMFAAAGGDDNFNLAQVLGAAPVATGGSISISGPVSTGTLKAAAGSNLSIAGVDAANSVTLGANGLASFLGVVSAPEISVTSGDISIAAGASLGKAGVTQVLNLFAVSSNPVVIGSSGAASSAAAAEGSRYVLDEAGDIVADTVNFTAQSGTGGTAPDIVVHDVTIEGSQTEGGGVGTVNVATGGNIIVDGHLLYANAAATDSLSLNAGNSIQVVTDNGGVAMTASDGSLSGTLLLTADNIWVGDQALIDHLIADPNFAGRDQALATNNGAANPEGSVRAGAITANVSQTLLVQNSGTSDDHAGLSVGDGGLTVNNTASTPATVIAYGRQVNSDGTVTGGGDFSKSVEFTGNFSEESRLNGCTVGGTCTTVAEQTPVPGPEAILGPVGLMATSTDAASPAAEESSESEEEEGESESESSVDPSVQLINSGPLQLDQSVDQPVTSGSDAMLTDGPTN